MKFLIKIEEAVDQLILTLVEKLKHAMPHSFYNAIEWLKHSPILLKEKTMTYLPKVKAFVTGKIGIVTSYTTMVRGHMVGFLIYLKSDEFKKKNKLKLIFAPIFAFKTHPVQSCSVLIVAVIFSGSGYFIYKNTAKIIVGTKALRAPASAQSEEEPIVEFKKLKYEVLGSKEIFLDVTLLAASLKEKKALEHLEKEIEERFLELHLPVTQLPISAEEMALIKKTMLAKVPEVKIKSIEVEQILEGRPKYFMQTEKMIAFKDLNLQLFLEDTKRNRQVWVDFTVLSTNRNIVLFLKDHEVEVRDYINMHVEPVIPQLPIEEEGRQIIKEKIKLELNQFLHDVGIEGKILEIYVDYIIVS